MPIYEYTCWDCTPDDNNRDTYFIMEVKHMMSETPKFTCPACGGGRIEKIISIPSAVYVKGDGYLDKKGAHRDMNRYKLQHNDPYAHMREPGEAEELDKKLKNQGRKNEGRTPIKFEMPENHSIQGEWDEKQQQVVWKEKDDEPESTTTIPSWLPPIH